MHAEKESNLQLWKWMGKFEYFPNQLWVRAAKLQLLWVRFLSIYETRRRV